MNINFHVLVHLKWKKKETLLPFRKFQYSFVLLLDYLLVLKIKLLYLCLYHHNIHQASYPFSCLRPHCLLQCLFIQEETTTAHSHSIPIEYTHTHTHTHKHFSLCLSNSIVNNLQSSQSKLEYISDPTIKLLVYFK